MYGAPEKLQLAWDSLVARIPPVPDRTGSQATSCDARMMHDTGVAWRKSLCDKGTDEDVARCQVDANKPYSGYKRDTTTMTGSK